MTGVIGSTHRRALALLLAGVYALSLSGSFLHLILVEHVRCAVHGDLVHADTGATADAHVRGPRVVAATAAATVFGGDRADEHLDRDEHEHCAVAAFTSAPATTSVVVVVVEPTAPPAPDRHLQPPAGHHVAWTERERFRLAPKGSPPA